MFPDLVKFHFAFTYFTTTPFIVCQKQANGLHCSSALWWLFQEAVGHPDVTCGRPGSSASSEYASCYTHPILSTPDPDTSSHILISPVDPDTPLFEPSLFWSEEASEDELGAVNPCQASPTAQGGPGLSPTILPSSMDSTTWHMCPGSGFPYQRRSRSRSSSGGSRSSTGSTSSVASGDSGNNRLSTIRQAIKKALRHKTRRSDRTRDRKLGDVTLTQSTHDSSPQGSSQAGSNGNGGGRLKKVNLVARPHASPATGRKLANYHLISNSKSGMFCTLSPTWLVDTWHGTPVNCLCHVV